MIRAMWLERLDIFHSLFVFLSLATSRVLMYVLDVRLVRVCVCVSVRACDCACTYLCALLSTLLIIHILFNLLPSRVLPPFGHLPLAGWFPTNLPQPPSHSFESIVVGTKHLALCPARSVVIIHPTSKKDMRTRLICHLPLLYGSDVHIMAQSRGTLNDGTRPFGQRILDKWLDNNDRILYY